MFGDSGWRANTVTKSAVHVRALTYCDIHMINVQKLKEILEFYKAFAQTFARNLVLTFDLSKRTVFYRIADKHLEKLLAEDNDPRTMFTPSQVSQTQRVIKTCQYLCSRINVAMALCWIPPQCRMQIFELVSCQFPH